MKRFARNNWFRWELLVVLSFAGCTTSVPLENVQGTVTLNGTPLPKVLITFMPEESGEHAQVRSMGMSDNDGKFTLRTESQLSGVLVGKHRVTVEDLAIQDAPRTPDGTVISKPPQRFPTIYSDPIRTPLQVTVEKADQEILLTLKSRL